MSNDKLQKWALIAEICGGAAVILSLMFVGFQVSQSNEETALNTRAIEVSAYQDLINQLNEINQIRATDEQLAALDIKARSGEELTSVETAQWRSYYRLATRHGDMAFFQFQNGFITEEQMFHVLGPLRDHLSRDLEKDWWTIERCRDFSIEFANQVNLIMAQRYPDDSFWKTLNC